MPDTPKARHLIEVVYQIRWFLMWLLVCTFFMSLLFRTPLDRVYLMILEFQLMCNFAIFHVPLPGNVEISI